VTVVSPPPREPLSASPSPALRARFLVHRARETATAREALDRGDLAWLATLGHNLHGSGRSFGFPPLSVLGAQIEAAATAGDATRLTELLVLLASAVADAIGVDPPQAKSPRGSGASGHESRTVNRKGVRGK
jgi:HPt (histidine-containing phosphotransfer) domain-containing protein